MIPKIDEDLKQAMLARDERKVATLRMIKAALTNARIEAKGELTNEQILSVLNKEANKRQEAIKIYQSAGQTERAAAEQAEYNLIKSYLPAALSQTELEELVAATIRETGASQPAQMGLVMSALKSKISGRADGATVAQLVKARLESAGS